MIARTRVVERKQLTPTAVGISLEKPLGWDSKPVQFVGLELDTDEGKIEYTMSMASSPTSDVIEFGARVTTASAWKRAFSALKPGDLVEIDGPYGHFVLDETHDAVLIAGGIGITPLKGMLEYATARKLPIHVTLLYGNRSEEEIAYRRELDEAARANPRATVVHTLSRPSDQWDGRKGRIDEALLREQLRADAFYYVCGVPAMVEEVVATLLRLGVARDAIKLERFHGYA